MKKFRKVRTFLCLLMAFTGMNCTTKQDGVMVSQKSSAGSEFEKVKKDGGIQEYRLKSNGLRVLLMEDHSSPVAAVMITYEAGSRNEWPKATGAAHMLEHMMFKGTAEYHKSLGTQIARLLENAGAEINATTSYDSTNYYAFLPNDKIPLALDIEAARMRGSRLDPQDFEREKTVIQNELERYFDSPVAALYNQVWQAAFTTHTYHHPIIGWREDVAGMKVEELRRFYDFYYRPDHAVLTVVGSFETAAVLDEIARRFSALEPSGAEKPAEPPVEPEQTETRRVEVHKEEGAEYLLLAFKTPSVLHPDAAAFDLLSAVLTSGRTSRLYRKLVQTGLAASVEASSASTRDPGAFSILATRAAGSHEEVEKVILETLEEIRTQGVTREEVERALNQTRAALAFSRDGAFSVAGELSHAIGMGDWTLFTRYLEHASAVTEADLKRVTETYLLPSRMTAGYLYTGSGKDQAPAEHLRPGQTGMPGEHSAVDEEDLEGTPQKVMPERIQNLLESLEVSPVATEYQKQVETRQGEKVKILIYKTQVQNVFAFSGSFTRAGSAYDENPLLAKLTAQMIDKGTQNRAHLEIPEILEDRGAEIHYGLDVERVRFQGRCLGQDADLVLELMAEQLRRPSFDAEEFRKLKEREKIAISRSLASTSSQAANVLMRRVFGEGHPLRPASFEEQLEWLEKTTVADLERFHKNHYGSQDLLLSVAGDFDTERIFKAVEKAFAGWEARLREEVSVPPFEPLTGIHYESAVLPGKQNADVLMGHSLDITRLDEVFFPLSLANAVLGGDFTARLSNTVRDQYGLTYGIRSGIVGVTESLPGAWIVHMIVNVPLLSEGLRRTFEQLELFKKEGITALELAEKKESLIGQFKTGLASTQSLADQILNVEELGPGAVYLDEFQDRIRAITLSQANDAIRRYFSPENFQVVTAGTPPEGRRSFDFPENTG